MAEVINNGRIEFRIADRHAKDMKKAAEKQGLALSAWIRLVCIAAAKDQAKK